MDNFQNLYSEPKTTKISRTFFILFLIPFVPSLAHFSKLIFPYIKKCEFFN